MPELRLSITERLHTVIKEVTQDLGIKDTDYLRSLLIVDLKTRGKKV